MQPSRWRDATLVGRIRRWSALTTASFAVIAAALIVLLVLDQRVYEPRVRDSVEATRLARLRHEAMLDQETALRAYLVSGDPRFLDQYERGEAALPGLDVRGRAAVAGDSRSTGLLLDVILTADAWADGWVGEALVAGRSGGEEPDQLLVRGKALFDDYRRAYEALATELVADREDALDERSTALQTAAGIALALTLVMALGSLRRNRQVRSTVEPALAAILTHLRDIARGDFSTRPPLDAPAELQQIDGDLNATAEALDAARTEAEVQSSRTLEQNHQLAQVLRLAREIAGSLNLRYVLRGVSTAASSIAGDRRVVVWLRSDDEPAVEARADTSGPGLEPIGLDAVAIGEGTVGRAARFGRIDGHRQGLIDGAADGSGTSLAIPMVVGAEVIGVLEVVGEGATDLPLSTLNVLEALAVQAASAIGSARIHQDTELQAMTDALTRLPNRRRLEVDLATEVGVSSRYGRPLAVAMIDVDHFKAYNDTLGHQAADVALQQLADVLTHDSRDGDTVYRYGGEEILIVMRETTTNGAVDHAERLRVAVEHHFSAPSQPRQVTVSIGVAVMPEHATGAGPLVAAADRALYEAKQAGRNRTCVAGA